jgi:hypothetical protein
MIHASVTVVCGPDSNLRSIGEFVRLEPLSFLTKAPELPGSLPTLGPLPLSLRRPRRQRGG